MKNKVVTALLLLTLTFSLIGCTKTPETNSSTEEKTEASNEDVNSTERAETNYDVSSEKIESDEEASIFEEVAEEIDNALPVEGIHNARQVAGLKTEDGKAVSERLLLRTGKLDEATDKDLEILTKDYQLKDIIDLRSEKDADKNPDPQIEGVNYYLLDLYGSTFMEEFLKINDVSKEAQELFDYASSGESDDPIYQDGKYIEYLMLGGSPSEYEKNFSKVMRLLVTEERPQYVYAQIFDILLASEGSSDIHCTSGKDRTGAAMALVLGALGVDRQTIIDEYMLTNIYDADLIEEKKQAAIDGGFPQDYVDAQNVMWGVTPTYINAFYDEIESKYGSTEEYLKDQIGLSDDDLAQLKEKFLK